MKGVKKSAKKVSVLKTIRHQRSGSNTAFFQGFSSSRIGADEAV